ncbi:MAG: HAMP domain-containing sensor histidine kinase [Chthoniobacter sp.]|nr:HAMP domain-containing sensor histidine kinase [Chthoniobacter sp.]
MGQDVRAWPMLALLLLVVLVAIGCVLWFMREAMRNERLAVREKLAEAYRGQLALVQKQAEEQWKRELETLDRDEPPPVLFAGAVGGRRVGKGWVGVGWADSVICFDAQQQVVYPQEGRDTDQGGEVMAIQAELRALVQAGSKEDVVKFVLERFAGDQFGGAKNAQGRLVAANAELLALESLGDPADPRFSEIAGRLRNRVTNYGSAAMPSTQRRFLMRELQRLVPGTEFPTLTAEDLAARYLEAHPAPVLPDALLATDLPNVWVAASPGHRALVLFSTDTLRARLEALPRDFALPTGVRVTALAPGEDATDEATLVTSPLAPQLPGWKLSLSLDNRALFDTAADRRVATYLWIGSVVIAVMTVLAIFIARGFGRQMQLARLKNDLVATVSHELKTPLTAMRALVDTLLDTEKFDEKTTREYLQLLAHENARLSRLIENFLTFSRLERGRFAFAFERLHPEAVVDGAVAAMGERRLVIETKTSAELPVIVGDRDALVTALLNLLDNAWKYSREEKRIVLRAEAEDGCVRFVVEDSGIGLTRAQCRRVFDRFYQADQRLSRTAGGCGLGLNIVRSIVEAHRGSVEVTSEPGSGSIFQIEIPTAA